MMKREKPGKNAPVIFKILTLFLIIIPSGFLSAQPFDILQSLDGYKNKVYFSNGNDERAKLLAERLERVYNFYQDKVSFEPKVTMLILNQQDWGKFTTFPVYGMPHYDEKRDFLIVASEDNDFWKSFIPDLSQLPKNQADEISSTAKDNIL